MLPKDVEFLTIDMPGHGLSSPIPPGMFYYSMDGVICIRKLQKYFGWHHLSLMGHSLGAMISFLYGMTYPKDVDFLICFDSFKPISVANLPVKRASTIDNFLKYDQIRTLPPKEYTMDELKLMWHEGSRKSVDLDKCIYLLQRMVVPASGSSDKYFLSRDPRLKTGVLHNFPDEETENCVRSMNMPIMVIKCKDSPIMAKQEDYMTVSNILKSVSLDYQFIEFPGTHHLHLNNPEVISKIVGQFINKHYKERNIRMCTSAK